MARISCGDLRFTNKNRNKSTTAQINKWIKEIISLYGTKVDYFVYDYQLLRQDGLLGEDRPAPFKPPVSMTAIVNVNNDNLMLSKFGLQTQSDIVMYVDYKTFGTAMDNNLARPKAGDLVRLTELGMDRPLGPYGYPYYGMTDDDDGTGNPCTEKDECGQTFDIDALICCKDSEKNTGDDTYTDAMSALSAWNLSGKAPFGPNIYEITTVRDEDIAGNLNPMMGHYVWKIEAIRFDNSYQPDAPVENGSNMVNDAPYYGKLPGGTETPENGKLYPQTTDKEEDTYWDHSMYNLDNVYGGYGYKNAKDVQDEGRITYDPKTDPYSDKYWVVYDSLPFIDLSAAQVGLLKFFDLSVVNEDIKLEETETPHGKPKAKYYLRDTSNCVDPNRLYVYALFVYDAAIALQYVGDVVSVDDVIYSSIFLKAKTENENGEQEDSESEDIIARLWVKDGSLALTVPVTEEDKKGEGEEEPKKDKTTYTDTQTKFGEDEKNPITLIKKSNNKNYDDNGNNNGNNNDSDDDSDDEEKYKDFLIDYRMMAYDNNVKTLANLDDKIVKSLNNNRLDTIKYFIKFMLNMPESIPTFLLNSYHDNTNIQKSPIKRKDFPKRVIITHGLKEPVEVTQIKPNGIVIPNKGITVDPYSNLLNALDIWDAFKDSITCREIDLRYIFEQMESRAFLMLTGLGLDNLGLITDYNSPGPFGGNTWMDTAPGGNTCMIDGYWGGETYINPPAYDATSQPFGAKDEELKEYLIKLSNKKYGNDGELAEKMFGRSPVITSDGTPLHVWPNELERLTRTHIFNPDYYYYGPDSYDISDPHGNKLQILQSNGRYQTIEDLLHNTGLTKDEFITAWTMANSNTGITADGIGTILGILTGIINGTFSGLSTSDSATNNLTCFPNETKGGSLGHITDDIVDQIENIIDQWINILKDLYDQMTEEPSKLLDEMPTGTIIFAVDLPEGFSAIDECISVGENPEIRMINEFNYQWLTMMKNSYWDCWGDGGCTNAKRFRWKTNDPTWGFIFDITPVNGFRENVRIHAGSSQDLKTGKMGDESHTKSITISLTDENTKYVRLASPTVKQTKYLHGGDYEVEYYEYHAGDNLILKETEKPIQQYHGRSTTKEEEKPQNNVVDFDDLFGHTF